MKIGLVLWCKGFGQQLSYGLGDGEKKNLGTCWCG